MPKKKSEPILFNGQTITLTGTPMTTTSWNSTLYFNEWDSATSSGGTFVSPNNVTWSTSGNFSYVPRTVKKTVFVVGNEEWIAWADAIMPGFGTWLDERNPEKAFQFGEAAFFYAG